MAVHRILKEGENVWKIGNAARAAFLVDAADYFKAFLSSIRQAERSILIAGWDIDSRLLLHREEEREEGVRLGEFLNDMARRTPELQIYILCWDYSMIYVGERELLPEFRLGWKTHHRIHFHADSEHPIGASQHQKFVVVDGAVTYCGGIDLTKMRWDTSGHEPDNPRRRSPNGDSYPPFHDIQMVAEGEVARLVGDVFRERWRRATGRPMGVESGGDRGPWPRGFEPDLQDVPVAVARTYPEYKEQPKVREVEALYRDAISAAEMYLYLENQYLTSSAVADALVESLRRERGPEIVLVLPAKSSGWLEQHTMDAIRFRVLERLFEADRTGRLRAFYPAADNGDPIYVHAKVMIADDRFAVVGSANLSNRSMALDSECDLAVEAPPEGSTAEGLRRFRNRLLAEHLGVTPKAVAEAWAECGSLIRTLEKLSENPRSLKPLDMKRENLAVDTLELVEDPELIDPAEPMEIDRLLDFFVADDGDGASRRRLLKPVLVLVLLAGMAAAWRWTPLSEVVRMENLRQWAISAKEQPFTLLWVVAAYIAGGLAMVPITLLIGATAVVFSPWTGSLYALAGCLGSAAAGYGVGAGLGKKILRRLAGKRLNRLSKRLSQPAILSVAIVRNIPVVPFTILNMIAGAWRVNLKNFILGTAVGMAPGIAALSLFTDRIAAAVQEPSWKNLVMAVLLAAGFGTGIWWFRRRLLRKG